MHRVSQQSSRDIAQKTYVDFGWLISCQSREVHVLSMSLPNGNQSVAHGGLELRTEEGRCWSMVRRLEPDEGHAFERGHLGLCLLDRYSW